VVKKKCISDQRVATVFRLRSMMLAALPNLIHHIRHITVSL